MPAHILNLPSLSFSTCFSLSVHADSAFSRLFKTVYPNGLDEFDTPGHTPTPSVKGSFLSAGSSTIQSAPQARISGFLSRFGFLSPAPAPPVLTRNDSPSDGAVEELIQSGAAFGELYFFANFCFAN
jgi:hypothetical protein